MDNGPPARRKAVRAGKKKPARSSSPNPAQLLTHLQKLYPQPRCALHHRNAYQLLVATILSAQCTDARVNLVTPALFKRYPDPAALASAEEGELEDLIRSTGFFRAKTRSLRGMAQGLQKDHSGSVPKDLDALTALPGVGRKTANVVLGTAFGIPSGVVVDTHVKRLAFRLGLTKEKDPVRIERDLMALLPREEWIDFSHRLILHGRAVCTALRPHCQLCSLASLCPRKGLAGSSRKPRRASSGEV